MARNHFASLDGTTIAIIATTGPFRSCAACGGQSARIEIKPVGYHAAELVCTGCGGHTAWLSRDHLAAMAAQKGAA